MNLTEHLAKLQKTLDSINLIEAAGHMDHPEDLVFLDDEPGARHALQQIEATNGTAILLSSLAVILKVDSLLWTNTCSIRKMALVVKCLVQKNSKNMIQIVE
jgi:hypothetical protein